MSDIENKVLQIIGQPKSELLEYKAVLPPARSIGQIIAAFANTNGGIIILGVTDRNGIFEVLGLSEDFRVNSIVHKAIDFLSPKPIVDYSYLLYEGKRIYFIHIEKSIQVIYLEDKIFRRNGSLTISDTIPQKDVGPEALPEIIKLSNKLKLTCSTESLFKLSEHYQSVINIISDLKTILYPNSPNTITPKIEGKILIRILFSSCADNFETYLSDLLYEIYLAKPESLKSDEMVTIKEVLDCSDIQEFINYYVKKKLSKLKRGSVKTFISENKQIDSLKVIGKHEQDNIEKLLQIRHLYAHNNGRADEKFIKYFPEFNLNDQHEMAINDVLKHIDYFINIITAIDKAAIEKFNLNNII